MVLIGPNLASITFEDFVCIYRCHKIIARVGYFSVCKILYGLPYAWQTNLCAYCIVEVDIENVCYVGVIWHHCRRSTLTLYSSVGHTLLFQT